jgi:hypothetical protein
MEGGGRGREREGEGGRRREATHTTISTENKWEAK